VPAVILKPTAVARHGTSYRIPRGLYRPDRESVGNAITMWMRTTAAMTLPPARLSQRIDNIEQAADEFSVNILGAAFLTGLRWLGCSVSFRFVAHALTPTARFLRVLYPDLDARAQALDAEAKRRILEHNTGPFSVYTVTGDGPSGYVAAQLIRAKVDFRLAVLSEVPARPAKVRDNLVHVPDSATEARRHLSALYRASAW
jgi:hypothetical protein